MYILKDCLKIYIDDICVVHNMWIMICCVSTDDVYLDHWLSLCVSDIDRMVALTCGSFNRVVLMIN